MTVVGDDDQAIYRFRGASQKNLLDFRQEFPDAAVVRLERNYRSGRRILKAAHAVVEPLPARIDKRLTGRGGGSVRFWRCRSRRRRRPLPPRPSASSRRRACGRARSTSSFAP